MRRNSRATNFSQGSSCGENGQRLRTRSKKSYRVTVPSKSEIKMLMDLDDDLLKPRRLPGRCQNGGPPEAVGVDLLLFIDQHLDRDVDK
jgi:hypothetical protein